MAFFCERESPQLLCNGYTERFGFLVARIWPVLHGVRSGNAVVSLRTTVRVFSVFGRTLRGFYIFRLLLKSIGDEWSQLLTISNE